MSCGRRSIRTFAVDSQRDLCVNSTVMDEKRHERFMMVLRQALLMVVRHIEKEYGLGQKAA